MKYKYTNVTFNFITDAPSNDDEESTYQIFGKVNNIIEKELDGAVWIYLYWNDGETDRVTMLPPTTRLHDNIWWIENIFDIEGVFYKETYMYLLE